jgi:hypothetical protein
LFMQGYQPYQHHEKIRKSVMSSEMKQEIFLDVAKI